MRRRTSVLALPATMLLLAISPSSHSVASGASPTAVLVQLETAIPVQLAAPSAPGLATRATITNTASSAISFQRGCGTGPVLLLRALGTGSIFRAMPAVASSSRTCVAQHQVLSPGGSIMIVNQYELRGYSNVAHPTLAGIPRATYQASLQLTYTILTGDPAHRYLRASDGDLIDAFPTTWTTSNPTSVQVEGTASPVPAAAPSSLGPFSPKVLVIDYNTSGLSSDGSAALTTELINALTTASRYHGGSPPSAQVQVYASYTENNPPPILPGTQHGTQSGDYQAVFTKYNICNLAATQGVNFVWIWAAGTEAGGPFYAADFYEWVATGPSFSQTYGTNVSTCPGHTVVTLGLNYSRDVALAVHSHGHYMEHLLQWAFGPASLSGPGGTDMYDIFDGQVARYAAYTGPLETSYAECGDVHYPPNTTQAYDYSNTQTVQSDCVTYNPGDPGSEREIATNVATWRSVPCDPSIQTNQGDCDQQSYLMWWMENMPGASNTVLDCGGSAMPNWWQYILALDSVTTTTSNQCQSDIRLNPSTGPSPASVSVAGSYFGPSETVRIYWDSTTSAPLGTTTTSNNGSFGISVRIPRSAAGTHTVIGVGATSGSKASATFTVTTKKQ